MLSGRPVQGGFRCDSIPLQILPPPEHAPRPPSISADHPFVLEFPLPRCELPELRFQRRSRRATEWARALNIFLPTRIQFQGPRVRQCWGMSIDEHHECRWVQQQYAYEPFNTFTKTLSEGVPPLTLIPFSRPNSDINAQLRAGRPIDELWIPNDLATNFEAFAGLQRRERIRFLRAATAIYAANDAWETSASSQLIDCVQAIEALSGPVSPPGGHRARLRYIAASTSIRDLQSAGQALHQRRVQDDVAQTHAECCRYEGDQRRIYVSRHPRQVPER